MRLVLVHGFSQSPRAWDKLITHLPGAVDGCKIEVTAPEVPDQLGFVETARTIGDHCGQGVYIGYSMGGRLCLRLALDQPKLVEALILVSSSPGIERSAERLNRRRSDEVLAQTIERGGVDAFVRKWLSGPMFATVANEAELAARASHNTVERLTHQLRELGQGSQEPLWDRLGELTLPVTLVTGSADMAYDAVAAAMAERIQGASRKRLSGGHALPLEVPVELASVITEELRQLALRQR